MRVTHILKLILSSSTSARPYVVRGTQRGMTPIRSQIVANDSIKTPAMRTA